MFKARPSDHKQKTTLNSLCTFCKWCN